MKLAAVVLTSLLSILVASAQEAGRPSTSQASSTGQSPDSGRLRQLVPGHYMYSTLTGGRPFSSGIIATSEGALVVDTLGSEAVGRAQRESITSVIKQPVRYLVSSSFHDQFSKGNLAYADVFKIGHDNYRAGLLEQMQRGGASADEQRTRLPNATFRDRMTLHVGGKEIQILYFGRAHTTGDSIVFVPQDRIAYLSELFFATNFRTWRRATGCRGCECSSQSKPSKPISSCRATVRFQMIQRKHGRVCAVFISFWSKREMPSRARSHEERPKIRRRRQ